MELWLKSRFISFAECTVLELGEDHSLAGDSSSGYSGYSGYSAGWKLDLWSEHKDSCSTESTEAYSKYLAR